MINVDNNGIVLFTDQGQIEHLAARLGIKVVPLAKADIPGRVLRLERASDGVRTHVRFAFNDLGDITSIDVHQYDREDGMWVPGSYWTEVPTMASVIAVMLEM